MRLVRTVALAALLVLAWAVVPTPAAAAPRSGGPTWLMCQNSTGELVGLANDVLTFTVRPCEPPSLTDALIVAYYATGLTPLADAQPYPPAGTTGSSSALSAYRTQAVCLLTSPSTRIACASVVVDAGGHPVLGDPLPTDSPLVAARINLGSPFEPPDCAACF